MVNAVILQKDALNYEILFTKVSSYIEKSLKLANISNVFYAKSFENITEDMLNCDDILFIDAVAPEIIEYDNLIKTHKKNNNDITFFALNNHSHTHGIVLDDQDKPCSFGVSDDFAKMDIFIMSSNNFKTKFEIINNPFNSKCEFLPIADSTIVFDMTDIVALNDSFKEEINFSHLKNDVFILDLANTYISSDVQIGKGSKILNGTIIKGKCIIGENCIIGPNAYISDSEIADNSSINSSQVFDSKIGSHTTVGPFAYIRPQSNIGDNVKIGDFVEVKKATIGNNSKVSHLTYIGDATVGQNVNFGCGTVVVNYDGFNKYQTIVEDNAFIGCNTNLVSPVKIEQGAFIAAGSTITKNVPKDALAVSRAKQETKPLWAKKFRELKSKK